MAGKKDKERLLKAKGPGSTKPEVTSEVAKSVAESICPLLEQLNNFKEQMSKVTQSIMATQAQMGATQTQMGDLIQIMKQDAEKIKEVTATTQKVKKKVQKLEEKTTSLEDQMLQVQMEKASLVLRFQGMPEKSGENLKEEMSELLAPRADMKKELLLSEMDLVYRSYSGYIKKNNLPGEIVVRFSKRHVRDAILKAVSGAPLKVGESIIRTLKDIPFEVRQRRKKYKELVAFLQTNAIGYKWLFPEGVTFKVKDKKEKIDSVIKAKEFLKDHLGRSEDKEKEEDSKSSGELDSGSSGEDSLDKKRAAAPKSSYKLRKKTIKRELEAEGLCMVPRER